MLSVVIINYLVYNYRKEIKPLFFTTWDWMEIITSKRISKVKI